jgi:HAD superfamily hydrolase (TIGR01509 family)
MSYKAVIFDMDGVILDSEPVHERAFRDIFREMGCGENHGINFPAYYGRSDGALWQDFIALHHPSQSLEELIAWKQRHLIDLVRKEQPFFEGALELIRKLAVHYPLALASGSMHPVIDAVLTLRHLQPYFKAVVSVQDVAKGKPSPDVFLRAAEVLGQRPADCWVIEDSAAGVEAALAGGFRVIGITNSLPAAKLARATHVVSSYKEIERILEIQG